MLEKQEEYYRQNRAILDNKYDRRCIVISDDLKVGNISRVNALIPRKEL